MSKTERSFLLGYFSLSKMSKTERFFFLVYFFSSQKWVKQNVFFYSNTFFIVKNEWNSSFCFTRLHFFEEKMGKTERSVLIGYFFPNLKWVKQKVLFNSFFTRKKVTEKNRWFCYTQFWLTNNEPSKTECSVLLRFN